MGMVEKDTPPRVISEPPAGPSPLFLHVETSNTNLAALVLTEKSVKKAAPSVQAAPAVPPPVAALPEPTAVKKAPPPPMVVSEPPAKLRPSFGTSKLGSKNTPPATTKALKELEKPDKRPAEGATAKGVTKKPKLAKVQSNVPPNKTAQPVGHTEEAVIDEGTGAEGKIDSSKKVAPTSLPTSLSSMDVSGDTVADKAVKTSVPKGAGGVKKAAPALAQPPEA